MGELVDDGLLEGHFALASPQQLFALSDLGTGRAQGLAQAVRDRGGRARRRSRTVIVPKTLPSHHRRVPQLMALQDGDDAGLADALPGQSEREGIELGTGQAQRRAAVPGPDEFACVQAPGCQPYADAVVHEHLQPVGASNR